MRSLRILASATVLLAGFALVLPALGSTIDTTYAIDLTFGNGATFVGTVEFNNAFTEVIAGSGTLTGCSSATLGCVAGDSYAFDLTSDGTPSYNGKGDVTKVTGVVLTDASWTVNTGTKNKPVYSPNDITMDFDVQHALTTGVTLDSTGTNWFDKGMGSKYESGLESYSITPVPEPASGWMLGFGLLGLLGLTYRNRRLAQVMLR